MSWWKEKFESIYSVLPIKKPSATPATPPPVSVDTSKAPKQDASELRKALAVELEMRGKKRRGAGTLLTGLRGVEEEAWLSRKTLLGA